MHVIAPEGVLTCTSKTAKEEWVEMVYDGVIACSIRKGRISDMQVTEDFEIKATQSGHLCSRKRKGKTGMARKQRIAEGVSWIQRR